MREGPKAPQHTDALPAAGHSRRRERGIALLLVLWLLVLLSVMAMSFSGTARTQALIARNLQDNAQARWMADAGMRLAVRGRWLAGDDRAPADGTVRFCRFQDGVLAVSLQDVSGLIDLNAAPVTTLAQLFSVAGAAEEDARRLAAAVADFRDRDDNPRPDGAEAQAYAAAGLAHGPKNGPFEAVEELDQVLGMPRALPERIRAAVTVHSRRPEVDLRTAPALVRAAYKQPIEAGEEERNLFGGGTRGTFAVSITARTESGAVFAREATLFISGRPAYSYRILRWTQGAVPLVSSFPDARELPPC